MTTRHLIASPRAHRATVPLLAMMALAGACTTDAPAELETGAALGTQLGLDAQYMRSMSGATNTDGTTSHVVDLADPGQYRFVINRLAAAGKTPASEPQLFERIEAFRVKALARAQAGRTTSAVPINRCGAFILPGAQEQVGTTLHFTNTRPEVSCFGGGMLYVYADITTYLGIGPQNILVASAAAEDLDGGIEFPPLGIDATLPIARGRLNRSDSLMIAFDEFFEELMLFSSSATSLQVAASIVVDAPSEDPESLPFSTRGKVSVVPTTGNDTCSIKSFDPADSKLLLRKKLSGGFCTTSLARPGAEKANEGTVAFEAAGSFAHTGSGGTSECDDTTLRTEPLAVAITIRGTAVCGDDAVPFSASHTLNDEPTEP